MTPTEKLKAIADDCREAADFYEKSPGLAGHGVNAGTVIDIYRRIALSIDAVAVALTSGNHKLDQALTDVSNSSGDRNSKEEL